ncbi:glycoside hydrolase [Niveispirillum sp. SYP-B3756]|uniref:glycosyl hydrolase n=1 Tax=Niveispirillum sp. SYP-B3756 TaxID=2662178 RepID=UPI001291BB14|nr:glycosyl hydrolase [Niveispirillum sp. SYP-B3756]MQP66398.1 glycoside hydrolase [Niveispirillum sp. SYP-B3756]
MKDDRWYQSLRAAALAATLLLPPAAMAADAAGTLEQQFRTPPASARPHVWWHWMNGNISADGAKLDLEWMQRAGIGGVQIFEGNLETPQLVPERLIYMSPAWKAALRSAVAKAQELGLEVAIASSPGWSATGGPWVKPEAAMKKLVWSSVTLSGGKPQRPALPQPAGTAGPYQDIPQATIKPGAGVGPAFYRDIAVLAWPTRAKPLPSPHVTASSGTVPAGMLADDQFGPTIDLPFSGPESAAWVMQSFEKPVTIRSVVVGQPGARGFGAATPPLIRLEASDDGVSFRPVATLPATRSPVRSAAFAPVTARHFRLTLSVSAAPAGGPPPFAAGVVMPRFPAPPALYRLSEFRLDSAPRVHRAEEKAGFAAADDYDALATPAAAVDSAPAAADVVDLTNRLRPDGTLDWTPPARQWRVVRFGYSLTGHQNAPAPAEATGLEVDKLSAQHVADYANHYFGLYRAAVGDGLIGDKGIRALLSDSIESGPQNWTENMLAEFRARRGYDALPWLPALTGQIIGGADESDRFLWDFRRTIAELLAEKHYGTLARVARENGLRYYAEALEDHRPQLGDDMEMRQHADIPMGAMWTLPKGGAPKPTFVADLQGAASVAHIYGKKLVAAEAFTAFGQPWAFSPRDLKPTADTLFALGVTRPIIHTSPHQPFTDGRAPGLALAPVLGQYFSRTETWAEQARGWTDYLARSAYLLQQGRSRQDIAYFYGEEAPITGLYGDAPPADLPAGHGFDFVGADALLNQLSVDKGDLLAKSGVRYKLLVLGGSSQRMTLPVLRRIAELAAAGATIVGAKPLGSPSLADDAAAFQALANQLWASGRILPDLPSALQARQLTPDWDAGPLTANLAVLHRQLDDGDLYFVSNRSAERLTGPIRFRVSGKAPELARAETGSIEPAAYQIADGRTQVPLSLEGHEALFVLFRKPATADSLALTAPALRPALPLTGPWEVRFQPGRGAPAAHRFDTLVSWTAMPEPGIRYFAGTARYHREFDLPATMTAHKQPIWLDLGDVREMAEIMINGQAAGLLWHPPYRTEITSLLKPGRNRIEVRVTNLWGNRLIGDAQPGAEKITYTQAPAYTAEAPLIPSGLLGPVQLLTR